MVVEANQSLVVALKDSSRGENEWRGMIQFYFSYDIDELCMLWSMEMNESYEYMDVEMEPWMLHVGRKYIYCVEVKWWINIS